MANKPQRQTVEALETRIRELETELEKTRAYQGFMHSVFHDLIAKLNPLLGFTSLLISRTQLDETQQSYASHISSSGKTMLALIYNFKDYSLLTSGQATLDIQTVKLRPMLEELMEKFTPWTSEKGLTFTLQAASNLPETIQCDSRRLKQMLENLIDNAVKFTPKGGIEFTVNFNKTESVLDFTVADTGVGMDEPTVQAMNAYFADPASMPPKFMQIGLINNKIHADLMNATLSVRSAKGKGSSFRFLMNGVKK